MSEHQKLLVIVGPTSSGKTKLAVDLAREFNGEIVSADSRQVYKGMDIGTGKDLDEYIVTRSQTAGDLVTIPYHLIDIVSPRTNFTLAQYQKRAYQAIDDILKRGKLPILVGGTGLYVNAVVDGYVLPQGKPDLKLRKKLSKLTMPKLLAKLRQLDMPTYQIIDQHNRRRVERAVEICLTTGKPLSQQREKKQPAYNMLILGLTASWELLYKRIEKRLKERLDQGLMEEVARLHKQGVSWKRLESFGLEYRYASRHIREYSKTIRPKSYDRTTWDEDEDSRYDDMVGELARAIKHFARRQMTWFKRDQRIVWVKNKTQVQKLVKKFLCAGDYSRS